jgi:hypothetical protein
MPRAEGDDDARSPPPRVEEAHEMGAQRHDLVGS